MAHVVTYEWDTTQIAARLQDKAHAPDSPGITRQPTFHELDGSYFIGADASTHHSNDNTKTRPRSRSAILRRPFGRADNTEVAYPSRSVSTLRASLRTKLAATEFPQALVKTSKLASDMLARAASLRRRRTHAPEDDVYSSSSMPFMAEAQDDNVFSEGAAAPAVEITDVSVDSCAIALEIAPQHLV